MSYIQNQIYNLSQMELNESSVIVAFSPCQQLTKAPWTFWRNNSLILLPQTFFIANSLQLNINSRVYHLDAKQQLYEIYRYNLEDTDYAFQAVGDTNSADFHETAKYIWERRTDLSNIHIYVIYINHPPFTMIKSAQDIQGYLGELFVALQEKLQFRFTLSEQVDQCWGIPLDNGSYSCMFGKLQRQENSWAIAGEQ
jgi:hypothetical protein